MNLRIFDLSNVFLVISKRASNGEFWVLLSNRYALRIVAAAAATAVVIVDGNTSVTS